MEEAKAQAVASTSAPLSQGSPGIELAAVKAEAATAFGLTLKAAPKAPDWY